MTKILIAFTALLLIGGHATAAPPDTLEQYEITADAHAFMCPFLSPRYMEFIQSNGDCSVIKTDDLVIHVYCYKENDLTPDELLKLADKVGYEPKNITIKRVR